MITAGLAGTAALVTAGAMITGQSIIVDGGLML